MSIVDKLRSLLGLAGSSEASAPNDEMISCEDALSLVHDFLDGELDSVPASRVKAHFDVCQRCYPHRHLESTFRDALRRAAGAPAAPDGLRDRLTSMIAEERAGE